MKVFFYTAFIQDRDHIDADLYEVGVQDAPVQSRSASHQQKSLTFDIRMQKQFPLLIAKLRLQPHLREAQDDSNWQVAPSQRSSCNVAHKLNISGFHFYNHPPFSV